MRKLFGTDGIRGVANVSPMTSEMAVKLGRALVYLNKGKHFRSHIVIGKDTRLSGYLLETAIASGICSMGADVYLVGPLPTPGIAFMTQSMRASAGVVISASHNPYQDNGIKIFSKDGFKLPDEIEEELEAVILDSDPIDHWRPTADQIGKAHRIDDAAGRYIVYLKNSFPNEQKLDGLKVVVDCANGAAYKVAPMVFHELGADVFPIGVTPDGKNINEGCGSLYPEKMTEQVKAVGANIGIALDGDADRVIVSDEKGQVVDGDAIMAICAKSLLQEHRLKDNTLVVTVMSNLGLEQAINRLGGKLIRAAVGDRYVIEELHKRHLNFGGEQSGHLIFLDYSTTGDGILAALILLSVMLKENKPLSELKKIIELYPQVLLNVPVRVKKDFEEMTGVAKMVKAFLERLSSDGRILLRYSGTELKARVMIEGPDKKVIHEMAEQIAAEIRKEIGS